MIQFFKERTPLSIIFLFVFGLLLKMPLFLFPKTIIATEKDEDLYHHAVSFINTAGVDKAILSSVIAFALLFIQAFMINYLVNQYRMTSRSTYLPAMAYLLITSLLPEWNYLSSPLIANTLIILAFIKLFRLYNLPVTRGEIFNMGLIIGISSYLYFPSAAFVVCLLLGILILIPFRLNEIIIFLLGCFTPYYFYGAYLFFTDRFSVPNFFPHISVQVPDVKSTIYLAISTMLLAIPFLIGGFFIQGQFNKMLIQVRKNWSILLLYLMIAFLVPFINSYMSFSNWILVAAPFAAFHASAYFYASRKWLPVTLLVFTVGFILYQQYGTTLWQ